MTAPVIESESQKIAMTAPVLASIDGESHTIAFGMPREYTLETLPTPTDPRVELKMIPEQQMAVIRFAGYRSTERVEEKTKELLAALVRDGVTVRGTPQYAGYNAPWTPPWLTRHEVLVEIE